MTKIFYRQPSRYKILLAAVSFFSYTKQAVIYDTTCNPGEYLRENKYCTPCAPGYYCDGGTSNQMKKCSPGFYTAYGETACAICPKGYYCSDPTKAPIACPDFTFSVQGQTVCTSCPIGSVCSQGQIFDTCKPGEVCNSNSQTIKTPCMPGYKCQLNSLPIQCPDGYFSGLNSSDCSPCPIGSYCPSSGIARAIQPVQCSAGFYQDQMGATNCKDCIRGYYCDPSLSLLPIRCDLGQFSPPNAASCIDCPAGYMCPDIDVEAPVLCPKGTYSTAKSSFCMKCPQGYSCLDRKTVTKCPNGFYSLTGMDSCLLCPAGHECSSWVTPMPCGPGQYSSPGSMSCTFCPIGNYCPSKDNPPIPCPLGQFQDDIGQPFCKPCPDGSICVNQQQAPVTCALGFFTDKFHQTCHKCPAGMDCSTKRFEDLKTCPRGTYSLEGESFCKKCPAGFYCEKPDAIPLECPTNTYSFEGSTSCPMCPIGFRCLDKKGKYIVKCKLGQFVSSQTQQCQDCQAGFFCPNPEAGIDIMIPCEPGSYAIAGQASCTICPAGKFCPSTTLATETACPAGQISFGGATVCMPCPKNHECSSSTTMAPCPIYHYSNEGEGVCKPCPNGKDCSNVLLTNPVSCPLGYYMQTLDWKCQPCPYGTMCPLGAIDPLKCKKHEYQSKMASTTCDSCPNGYYSDVGFEYCHPIPAGFQRDIDPNSVKTLARCPEKYYSDWGFAQCELCPDGFLCPSGGELGVHYGCPKGSYCTEGIQKKCSPGMFGLIDRARKESEGCGDCPAGFYCLEGTENFNLHPCPRGSFCPVKTGVPLECPMGTYNDELFARSIADCKLCPMGRECSQGTKDQGSTCQKGYYCPLGSYPKQWACPAGTFSGYRAGLKDQSECMVCPAGNYCPRASINPIKVLKGYYQPHQGIGENAARVICPPGYHCPNDGMVTYKGYHCSPGHYCPAGSISPTQKKCPEGTYSDSYEIFDASQCLICPAGFKCSEATTSFSGITACQKNEYCPPGTPSSKSNKCPAGSYAPYTNSKSMDDCIPCPYGYYCLSGQDPADCPKGFYCPKSTKFGNQFPCPAGFFIDYLNAKVQGECKPCGTGNYCPDGIQAPIPCPGGTYNAYDNNAKICQECPPGKYCPGTGTQVPPKCPPGKYSDKGSLSCLYCEVGTYCPNEATTIDEKNYQLCPAGVYCMRQVIDGGSTRNVGLDVYPNLRDHYCSEGYYCIEGATSTTECPIGTYNRLRGRKSLLDCKKVEAGFYTNVPASTASTGPCDPGFYCPEGSTSAQQVPCPAGTFRSISKGSSPEDCTICTSGGFCPLSGMNLPFPCPAGFYCPIGTRYPEPCPEGTFSNKLGLTDSQSCQLCDSGKYCGKKNLTAPQGDCDDGYLCIKGSKRPEPTDKVTGSICPKGGYCLKGAIGPSWCPDGNFNLFEGGQSSDDCESCWGGYYCKGQEILVPCPAGKYCESGTSVPTLVANQGYYAPAGSDQQYECPRGTYNTLPEQAQCKSCEAGYLCDSSKMSVRNPCPMGHYCQAFETMKSAGQYYEKIRCPSGTYNPTTGKKLSSDCLPCDNGKYCSTEGLNKTSGDCTQGFFCKKYSVEPEPQVANPNSFFGPCPAGSYCPSGTQQIPCPKGTFSSETKATSDSVCRKCTEGWYCDKEGLTAPVARCEVGFYCPEGSTTSKGAALNSGVEYFCKAKEYCPLGSGYPIVCPTGFYQDQERQGKCNPCPKGFYCIFGVMNKCLVGHYCP